MIYLDQAATSWPKPIRVVEAVNYLLTNIGANPGRGNYGLSMDAANMVNRTRDKVADFFGLSSPKSVVFTANATEAINAVLQGLLKPGDHVITSSLEHNAVARTLFALESKGISTTKIYTSPTEGFRLARVEEAIRSNTKMIVWNHASNVFGTLSDLDGLARLAHAYGLTFLVDAAQTVGSLPIDMEEKGIDYLACSGHKGLYGPQGVGLLLIRDTNTSLNIWRYGETGDYAEQLPMPKNLPNCYEAGTPNMPGIAGLGEGIDFIREHGLKKMYSNDSRKIEAIYTALNDIEGVVLYGPEPGVEKVPILSFNIRGMISTDVGIALNNRWDICVRTGLQSAYWAHETGGTLPHGTVRVSVGCFNTGQDIEELVEAVETLCYEVKNGKSITNK
ncbi:MAG TPA: aminotransferase class V-fold PLP-dependent enzyme [Bacillota bacterium]|nr:aminotransferase class V-fold PLP-dependent enzyme [Bacillota bacterium]